MIGHNSKYLKIMSCTYSPSSGCGCRGTSLLGMPNAQKTTLSGARPACACSCKNTDSTSVVTGTYVLCVCVCTCVCDVCMCVRGDEHCVCMCKSEMHTHAYIRTSVCMHVCALAIMCGRSYISTTSSIPKTHFTTNGYLVCEYTEQGCMLAKILAGT